MNEKIKVTFLEEYHTRFSSETTRSYRISLRQFFTFVSKPYDEIKSQDIRAWLAALEENGLKRRSINLKLSAVRTFYRYCKEENLIKKDPTAVVKAPKPEDSLPYYLTKMQVTLLQELTRPNPMERAIVEVLYTTGVRISELLNIKLSDIKWETRQIWIRKGKGNKERFVLFTHECAVRLQTYLDDRVVESEYLFCHAKGKAYGRDTIQKYFRGYTKELGFRVSPHTMRHTFAAHLAEKNMPQSYIQDLLWHVNINSTRIYTRLMNHARKKKYDQYQ
ncbi:tyrosine-type recombinase/integrase [Sporosarcina ureae]|uniref:Integrase n=1 Tax=Sporosarcina ureae TaxID=1571 RepID=A0ABN4YU87_SPOUR|nr:tyrosine-type recombinase/integrase [Sporosarcina ureae]ARF14899.1 integrase [Sporosarcina ureae]